MHDTIAINVPFRDEFIKLIDRDKDIYSLTCDVTYFGIKAVGEIVRNFETDEIYYSEIKHPFDSIPSDYQNLVIKVYHCTRNCVPYLLLQGSPKILQGHNVFWVDSINHLVTYMFGLLLDFYPHLFACLDIRNAHIARLDATYSIRLPHERLVKPVNDMLGRVSVGQRRPDAVRNVHSNTYYWNTANNRTGYCKAYGKTNDLQKDINKLKRTKNTSVISNKLYRTLTNDRLQDYASGLLRLEATNKKDLLKRQDIPTNVWEFICYQRRHTDVLEKLWWYWFEPIIKAVDGEVMTDKLDDSKIYQLTRKLVVYKTIKPNYIKPFNEFGRWGFAYRNRFLNLAKIIKNATYQLYGKLSYTKANNAYNFYKLIKQDGFNDVKSRMTSSTFSRNVKSLTSIGLSRAFLQNLSVENTEIITLNNVVDINFEKQAPADFVMPPHKYLHTFDSYLNVQLKLVA